MRGGIWRTYAYLYLLFLYLPIILLPLFAFNNSTIIAFPLTGFTLEWFRELGHVEALHNAVYTSLKIAVVSALISTLLGICAARAAARYHFRFKGGMMGLIMLPLVLPEIIVAVSLLVVFLQIGLSLGMLTVVLGHVLICTPFCIAILNGAFQSLDNSLEEAAVDLGCTGWEAFRLVILPLVMPGIIASLLIAFTISMDEFIIAFFLSGSDATLPVYLWGQLRFPKRLPVVMALGTILVIASVVLLTLAEYARRRGVRRRGQKDHGGFL